MPIALLLPEYFLWHYTTALRLCLNIATNFIWFAYHFFSIPVLLRTFHFPWRHVHASHPGERHTPLYSEKLAVTMLLCLIGMIVRTLVLAFGLAICLAIGLVGLGLFLLWFILPAVVIIFILWALYFLL